MRGTIAAIQEELVVDGFVLRYLTEGGEAIDGLPAGEGAFLPCTFWLADNLALLGATKKPRDLRAKGAAKSDVARAADR